MTRLATAFALAVGLACTASAVAQPAAPVARGAAGRRALRTSRCSSSRAAQGRRASTACAARSAWARRRASGRLGRAAPAACGRPLARRRRHRRDRIIVRLASLGTDLLRVRTPFGGLDYLVVGELRELHIRRPSSGERAGTLPPIEDEALTAAVVAYYETRETAPLATAESDQERPAGLRQVASALATRGSPSSTTRALIASSALRRAA